MKRIQLRAEALLCKTLSKFTAPHWLCEWHGGVVVRVVGQQSAGCRFNTQLRHFRLVFSSLQRLDHSNRYLDIISATTVQCVL